MPAPSLPQSRQLHPYMTAVGFEVAWQESAVRILRAPNWFSAVRARYLEYGRDGSSAQSQFQFCCVLPGELYAAGTVDELPVGPPAHQPRGRVVDLFTVVGWDGAAQNGAVEHIQARDWMEAAHYVMMAAKNEGRPYQFVSAFRGLHRAGPAAAAEWDYAHYLMMSRGGSYL